MAVAASNPAATAATDIKPKLIVVSGGLLNRQSKALCWKICKPLIYKEQHRIYVVRIVAGLISAAFTALLGVILMKTNSWF